MTDAHTPFARSYDAGDADSHSRSRAQEPSANFRFLGAHDPLLARLAAFAEQHAHDDPNATVVMLGQLAEALLRHVAANVGSAAGPEVPQLDLLRDLETQGALPRDIAELFHYLGGRGNDGAHRFSPSVGDAVHALRVAHQVAIWFHRSFGGAADFAPGPFLMPASQGNPITDPPRRQEALRSEEEVQRQKSGVRRQVAGERETLPEAAADVEHLLVEERARTALVLEEIRRTAAARAPEVVQATVNKGKAAAELIELDEADTRKLIDNQLRAAGWETDSEKLRYAAGARPQKGRNLAIAEWPTKAGPADYVLFAGIAPMAVVEAKRKAKNIPGSVEQAKRYSRGFVAASGELSPGAPWGEYRIPFLFATNGRAYLKQLEDQSGVWFLDARRTTNHARALESWYTPQGLQALLAQDIDAAEKALQASPPDYLPLRDYQQEAIRAIESGLAAGRRSLLLAMATGTGKTRTLLGLIYRLLKANRIRRVLLLVDRSALGHQASDTFKDVRLENQQALGDIYDVKELGDLTPEGDTRVQVATVQGMVRRILYPGPGDSIPAVDAYDCVVIDEAHRGYTLDRELTDAELTFRSEIDYISKYRRVLEHFDALKIGLTATPALHTTEIFGKPVFTYSYRQAVIDGWLVDHEPPVRIRTKLSEDGIAFGAGEPVPVFDVQRSQIEIFTTPDEIEFEVEEFNRKVVTENFNQVVCRFLATQIDPSMPGKTLVYCVDDKHADLVVRLLKTAFDERYGGVEDEAVSKITGAADKPLQLIRRYKNERLPSVAVTVDLLTTGVDVPEIVNLVFLRRVRSRILYEQMLGRATRLRPDLYGAGEDKEVFRIFDAVDIYSALERHTTMTAVVAQPNLTFSQLVTELQTVSNEESRTQVHEQIIAKLQRKRAKLENYAADQIEASAGMSPKALLKRLREMRPTEAARFFDGRAGLVEFLDRIYASGQKLVISEHADELRGVEHGFPVGKKPEDYLEEFGAFIRSHQNAIPALLVVMQRPRDLTRRQLKELKLALDAAGFSDRGLQTAWRDLTNEDIAASIIGFIRQKALGDPLRPYAERVDAALKRVLASRPWTPPQRSWLERIGKAIKQDEVVDREAFESGQFKAHGGFDRINRVFDGQLDAIVHDLHEAVWQWSA